MTTWRIEPLGKKHDRSDFDCGRDSLNTFLNRHATQNARKGISRTYVYLPADSNVVTGYYILSSDSITLDTLPDDIAARLPRYPVPTVHIGRLAVDVRSQSRGIGGILLFDALKRIEVLAGQIGICGVTVYALDDRARGFYQAFEFRPLKDHANHLFLPLATIRKL
ncbi:MAG: GNAT family N-acetyltransferase [Phycisphaerae bacterium]|nr:GNAT family N-acetyltransferase [Planctomycetota bacterium]MBL7221854.1 GNAT family N-acetyltransferase [Phycisphaerae bacterium]